MAVETILYTTLRGDNEPVEELPAEIINFGYRLNRPGQLSFSLALDHPFCTRTVVGPGTHEAVVVRNRQIVWRGPVWTANETDSKTDRKVEFGAEGLFSYTRKMHVTSTLDYTGGAAADLAVIGRALINHHQNKAGGNFGIDTSGSETTRQGERLYNSWERKNIYEALIQLAEVDDGFDFEVDPETRRYIAYYPQQGNRKPDLIWQDGIRGFTRTIDATSQASQVLGIGDGEGEDMLLRSLQDSGAVSEYGLANIRYTNKDVKFAATLDDHIRRELSLMKNPAQTVGITLGSQTLNPFSYSLGDEGRLIWDSPYDPVNEFRRRVGFDVIWQAGEEQTIEYLEELAS
jgi:hypothetical protein